MSTKLFVNLPVTDLDRTMTFFRALGFAFNPQFTDETAACMVLSEHNYVMLLTHPKFSEFTRKTIADASQSTEVILAMSAESREAVDELLNKVIEAGGRERGEANDHGFMYLRGFEDLDGHIWETFYMDPAAVQPQQ